eukprot:CAMPEP_0114500980 /NCGR_PEP_ID=MMETSP0109-20121206/8253_1 /TAXON_ID=29199 /ORGANISM="Chlorarachnion reptans, Strain CCCM449" /LENGTH=662 /DNA_ID=CAMNT_0001678677 /DNA_START=488 /DNA_END=2473 /DNA_ORIENTATION=-
MFACSLQAPDLPVLVIDLAINHLVEHVGRTVLVDVQHRPCFDEEPERPRPNKFVNEWPVFGLGHIEEPPDIEGLCWIACPVEPKLVEQGDEAVQEVPFENLEGNLRAGNARAHCHPRPEGGGPRRCRTLPAPVYVGAIYVGAGGLRGGHFHLKNLVGLGGFLRRSIVALFVHPGSSFRAGKVSEALPELAVEALCPGILVPHQTAEKHDSELLDCRREAVLDRGRERDEGPRGDPDLVMVQEDHDRLLWDQFDARGEHELVDGDDVGLLEAEHADARTREERDEGVLPVEGIHQPQEAVDRGLEAEVVLRGEHDLALVEHPREEREDVLAVERGEELLDEHDVEGGWDQLLDHDRLRAGVALSVPLLVGEGQVSDKRVVAEPLLWAADDLVEDQAPDLWPLREQVRLGVEAAPVLKVQPEAIPLLARLGLHHPPERHVLLAEERGVRHAGAAGRHQLPAGRFPEHEPDGLVLEPGDADAELDGLPPRRVVADLGADLVAAAEDLEDEPRGGGGGAAAAARAVLGALERHGELQLHAGHVRGGPLPGGGHRRHVGLRGERLRGPHGAVPCLGVDLHAAAGRGRFLGAEHVLAGLPLQLELVEHVVEGRRVPVLAVLALHGLPRAPARLERLPLGPVRRRLLLLLRVVQELAAREPPPEHAGRA